MKSLLLISALMFAPVGEVTEPTIQEPTTSIVEETTAPSEEITTEPSASEETTTPSEQPEEPEIPTNKEELLDFLAKYISEQFQVSYYIAFAIASAVIVLLIVLARVLFTTRKYKSKTSDEMIKLMSSTIKETFDGISKEQIKTIVDSLQANNEAIKIIVKALALAQDRTAEGKKALLDLMLEISKEPEFADKETIEKLNENKVAIEKEEIKKVEINDKVKANYTPID